MRAARTPGDVLRDVLVALNVTQDQFAEAIDVSRYSINQIVNGRRSITVGMALRFARVTGTTPEFWLNLQRDIDIEQAIRSIGREVRKLPVLATHEVQQSVHDCLEGVHRTPDDVQERFNRLAEQWHAETGAHSSMTIRKRHPAYQEIVGLGWQVVPALLDALTSRPDFWFALLRDITGENPVPLEDRGHYDLMASRWREWGKQKGLG